MTLHTVGVSYFRNSARSAAGMEGSRLIGRPREVERGWSERFRGGEAVGGAWWGGLRPTHPTRRPPVGWVGRRPPHRTASAIRLRSPVDDDHRPGGDRDDHVHDLAAVDLRQVVDVAVAVVRDLVDPHGLV